MFSQLAAVLLISWSRYAISHHSAGLVSYYDDYGECLVTRGPLCGNDGTNYKNICTFWEAQKSKPDLKVRHYGGCGADDLNVIDTTFGRDFQELYQTIKVRRKKKTSKKKVKVQMKYGIDY